jgi:chromate reductase
MTQTYQIGVIVGSNRRDSLNRRLAGATTRLAPPSLQFVDIAIDHLPMYNPDFEADRPAQAHQFTRAARACDGFLIVMPEHNRSLPAVLKNAIDWGSKPTAENVWRDKPAAIMGASPGAIGTAVGQQHLRQILGILGATVLGGEAYISYKAGLIDSNNDVTVDATREFLTAYVARFGALVGRLTL